MRPRMGPHVDFHNLGGIAGIILDLACGDLGDLDGSADHVSGALLAFGAFGHGLVHLPKNIRLVELPDVFGVFNCLVNYRGFLFEISL